MQTKIPFHFRLGLVFSLFALAVLIQGNRQGKQEAQERPANIALAKACNMGKKSYGYMPDTGSLIVAIAACDEDDEFIAKFKQQ